MALPSRGEVWIVDLGMTAKIRPCLIVSHAPNDDDRALVTIVPHTTSARGSHFEVAIDAKFLKSGVFDAQNIVTIPIAKLVRRIEKLDAQQLERVEQALRSWLGL